MLELFFVRELARDGRIKAERERERIRTKKERESASSEFRRMKGVFLRERRDNT